MSAAVASNKSVKLGTVKKDRPTENPEVVAAQATSLIASRYLKSLLANPRSNPAVILAAKSSLAAAKSSLQRIVRSAQVGACYDRDSRLFTILEKNPSDLFKSIKKFKKTSSTQIQKLVVGDKIYTGSLIPDGFYASLSSLKAPDMSNVHHPLLPIL